MKSVIVGNHSPEMQEKYKTLLTQCFTGNIHWIDHFFPLKEYQVLFAVMDQGKIEAAAVIDDFKSFIHQTQIRNGGIGAVGTLPEARNQGAVRLLFGSMFQYMKNNHYGVSTLYPFKFSYYEKFGYHYIGGHDDYLFEPLQILKKDTGYRIVRYNGTAREFDDLKNVHDRWILQYDFGIRLQYGSPEEFRNYLEREKGWTYLVYDPAGVPQGFVVIHYNPEKMFSSKLEIKRIAWLNREALQTVFNLLADHRDQSHQIRWMGPAGFPIRYFLKETRIEHHHYYQWMAKAVDLETVLMIKTKSLGFKENLVFSYNDPAIPENSGTWVYRDGQWKRTQWTGENVIPEEYFNGILFGSTSLGKMLEMGFVNKQNFTHEIDFFRGSDSLYINEFF